MSRTTEIIIGAGLVLLVAIVAIYSFWQSAYAPDWQEIAEPAVYKDLIMVTSPLPRERVESPLIISGLARGNWYFEATFPIRLTDKDGLELAVGYAEAKSNWMTSEYVPFEAELKFTKPGNADEGILILEKSNASGLPEHDDEVKIIVRF